MNNSEKAVQLFLGGYNCAQAVLGAFVDDLGIEQATAFKIAVPFGGGVGRLREVCGACSGMLMAYGMLYGYSTPETGDIKAEHYSAVRKLCEEFKDINSSIICREILKTDVVGGFPAARTEQYYNERPCVRCVRTASEILENAIKQKR